jgi:hypothetical protein
MDAKLKELYAAVKEQSDAAKKAKAMGLVSKGYGRWADPKTDKVVAQTKKGKLEPIGGDKGKKKATKQDVDSDMYAQDTWDKFGGDTGTDADFQGEPPEGAREPDDDYDPETGEFTGDDEFALSGTDTDDPAGGRGDAWMHGDEEPSRDMSGDAEEMANKRMSGEGKEAANQFFTSLNNGDYGVTEDDLTDFSWDNKGGMTFVFGDKEVDIDKDGNMSGEDELSGEEPSGAPEESVIEVNGVKYAPVVSEEDDKHSFAEMFKRISKR